MSDIAAAPDLSTQPLEPLQPPPQQPEPFSFTGRAGEYFGIWIVNLLLTIVTLGIYSAWAKVRRKRYFYGNTWLAGANFEYHGNPIAILKGRVIAFVLFVGYSLAAHFSPRLGAVILLALMPAVPWFIVRSMAFNAVNSSYRNLRFHFTGTYREAAAAVWPFALLPLIGVIVPQIDPAAPPRNVADVWYIFISPVIAIFVYPYVIAKLKLLHVNRSRYGTAPFACHAAVKRFYWIYFTALLLSLFVIFLAGIAAAALMRVHFTVFVATTFVLYVVGVALLMAFTRSRVGNLVFNESTLAGGGRFVSTLGARKLALLYGTNMLAILATVGLAIPWAAMRTARYRAECLVFLPDGDIESFVGGLTSQVGAAGEEVGEMFSIDLSL
jgi:uncharacterized membrane protein YjgN (DUF898 family)